MREVPQSEAGDTVTLERFSTREHSSMREVPQVEGSGG